MKIVFVSNWYSENMGYLENSLPKALAALGHDVYLLTSTGQVYFNQPHYQSSFEQFLGAPIQPEGLKLIEGVKVYRLSHYIVKKQIILKGLIDKIRIIKPDVVHTFVHSDINSLQIVVAKLFTPFKLFTANHTSALAYEVSIKENKATKWYHHILRFVIFKLPGTFISFFIKKCFCVTVDAIDVATKIYGVQRHKAVVTTLGVDTDIFKPDESLKKALRKTLGYAPNDIICIYTGKLTLLKNPLILAKAIQILSKNGLNFKGLFIGGGEQYDEIAKMKNCKILPFQQHKDLPQYYQMADIAVWPFGESSSQIDVVATGLCLILSDSVQTYDLVDSNEPVNEKGIYRPKIVSRFVKSNNEEDLAHVLETLGNDAERTKKISLGMAEINSKFSWTAIAKQRLIDYNS